MVRRGEDRLAAEEEAVLIRTVQSHSPQAEEALVSLTRSLEGLVRSIARHEGARRFADDKTFDSLIEQGAVGVAEAITGFHLKYGTRLSTYAYFKIRRRVTAFLNSKARPCVKVVSLEEPVGRGVGDDEEEITYADVCADESLDNDVRERAEFALLVPQLRKNLRSLTPRQREVVHHRFCNNETPAEISRALGITRMRVGQILNESLGRLRKLMVVDKDLGLN